MNTTRCNAKAFYILPQRSIGPLREAKLIYSNSYFENQFNHKPVNLLERKFFYHKVSLIPLQCHDLWGGADIGT